MIPTTTQTPYLRRPYVDGSPTPLFRGILHFFMTFALFAFNIVYFWRLSLLGLVSAAFITISYVFSSLLHCAKLPAEFEVMVNKLDHIAVHMHAFGHVLNLFVPNTFYYIVCTLIVCNSLADAYFIHVN